MISFKSILIAGLATVALLASAPAQAVPIANGTVASSHLFNPTVDLSTNPGTFGTMNGATFETSGTGGFASAAGNFGTLNGTLTFSQNVGTTLSESLSNFFTFGNGTIADFFKFSVDSVQTLTFSNNPGVATASSLYLLGSTLAPGLEATPTSLTISFNKTGNSAYSSSATLTVPPSPPAPVPEPATLALLGAGLVGVGALRRRRSI